MSKAIGKNYLEVTTEQPKLKYKLIIYNFRVFVSMPVRLVRKNCPRIINVIFCVDTRSPFAFIAKETIEQLYGNCPQVEATLNFHYNCDNSVPPYRCSGLEVTVRGTEHTWMQLYKINRIPSECSLRYS